MARGPRVVGGGWRPDLAPRGGVGYSRALQALHALKALQDLQAAQPELVPGPGPGPPPPTATSFGPEAARGPRQCACCPRAHSPLPRLPRCCVGCYGRHRGGVSQAGHRPRADAGAAFDASGILPTGAPMHASAPPIAPPPPLCRVGAKQVGHAQGAVHANPGAGRLPLGRHHLLPGEGGEGGGTPGWLAVAPPPPAVRPAPAQPRPLPAVSAPAGSCSVSASWQQRFSRQPPIWRPRQTPSPPPAPSWP